ncbi:Xaa-Pro dipeptidase [Hirschia baltica]|uniref:Amidohydrolase n=1 Tax=Hirschia baltica (strain ATCC 49814 / DSM 5838 / IFAM 1418) TaxID=582402 RepID=C6XQZ3_HIRBI|nr:amidohydrolase family protein [Hirschia baltica]ACT60524.1 amidohydrolase [Hirschia baltica ATCC 49814]
MKILSALSVCFAFFISSPSLAQETTSKTLLINADLIDVVKGKLVKNQAIAIENGKITFVGNASKAPDGDWETLDMAGATLLPGLSDSHVHLTSNASDHGYRRLTISTPRAAINGVANAKKTLLAGFTSVRNLGAPGYADIALKDSIEDGIVIGPRIIASGPSLGITGGHCDSNLLPFEYQNKAEGVADGPWAVRAKVRQNNKYGAEVIKFCGTGGVLSKGTKLGAQQFTFEEMAAIVDEAHLLGLKVAVHAHGSDGIATALKAGVDSVEHASMITDEDIQVAIEQGTYLSMDIYVSDFILSEGEAAGILEESLEKERKVGRLQRERFQAAVKAGAKMAFGTDGGVYSHGLNARQFAKMVEWGMTPMQAIQASTIGNATLFGTETNTGSIEVGKFADIVAVSANPLTDVSELEDIDFVMKDGVVYKNTITQ